MYNRLLTQHSIRYLVNYTRLSFEVTGGFFKKVCSVLHDLLESEEAAKATLSATEWSWSPMGLPAYFQQAISLEIVRMMALSVQNGIRLKRQRSQGQLARSLSSFSAAFEWRTDRLGLCQPFNLND